MAEHGEADNTPKENDALLQSPAHTSNQSILWKLYISHTLSTWNARTFEFGSVVFLVAIFPGSLFFVSSYAMGRSVAVILLSSWVGNTVDRNNRLRVVRHSIIWQRFSVASSCLILLVLLNGCTSKLTTYSLFAITTLLAGLEKLAFVGNTMAVERDWIIVVSESLGIQREELNSVMRRIDLICKLVAPVCISLVDGFSTKVALWVVFIQTGVSTLLEYYAIARVYSAIPELSQGKGQDIAATPDIEAQQEQEQEIQPRTIQTFMSRNIQPWKNYFRNPAFLPSFSFALLYFTVLSFGPQMATYLLNVGFSSTDISLIKLITVGVELSATFVAPFLIGKIGAVRSGLWFVNEQLVFLVITICLFSAIGTQQKLSGGILVIGVTISRLGAWGFDLSTQYLVQEYAPAATRGSFSAVEVSLRNVFWMASSVSTMIFYRPEQFQYPMYISVCAIALSAMSFASFVRKEKEHSFS